MKRTDEDETKKIRCAIYTRKSHEEGLDQEFNSLDAQRESAENFIASQQHEGWTVIPTRYDDGGFSGGNLERPAMKRLMTDIKAGLIDCVVVYKVDRLSRALLDFSRIMGTFDEHGVSFVSVTQHFNTTHSMSRLTLNILLSFAQFERESVSMQELEDIKLQQTDLRAQLARYNEEAQRLSTSGEPEQFVSDRLARLHSQVAAAERSLAATQEEAEAIRTGQLTEFDVNAAFADFDNVWDALTTLEKSKVIKLLIERVSFDATDSTLAITMHPSAIKSLTQTQNEEPAA